MRGVRALPHAARRDVYVTYRIADQRDWYARKAAANRRAENRWMLLVIAAQTAAVAAAVARIALWSTPYNPTGFFASMATALMAWMQLKRQQELAQAYNIASHELGLIAESARFIASDSELADFVADAESAMSREHTLWIARRRRG